MGSRGRSPGAGSRSRQALEPRDRGSGARVTSAERTKRSKRGAGNESASRKGPCSIAGVNVVPERAATRGARPSRHRDRAQHDHLYATHREGPRDALVANSPANCRRPGPFQLKACRQRHPLEQFRIILARQTDSLGNIGQQAAPHTARGANGSGLLHQSDPQLMIRPFGRESSQESRLTASGLAQGLLGLILLAES
jgi:hypothetical protein